jgi:hypothetical protein
MATKSCCNTRLLSGFFKYKELRTNGAAGYKAEEKALQCPVLLLLQKNLMFLSLCPRLKCSTCQKPCDLSTCEHFSKIIATAIMITTRFNSPPWVILDSLKNEITRYLEIGLLADKTTMFLASFRGQPDEEQLRSISRQFTEWKEQKQVKLYGHLDQLCREQAIYPTLML